MEPTSLDYISAIGAALAAIAALGAFVVSVLLERKVVSIEEARRNEERTAAETAHVTVDLLVVPRHHSSHFREGTQTEDRRYLAITNTGQAAATEVTCDISAADGEPLVGDPVRTEDDEFPIPVLDAGSAYPLPFRPVIGTQMRLRARVEWNDPRGNHERTILLRRY